MRHRLSQRVTAVLTITATLVALAGGPAHANSNGTNYIYNGGVVGGLGVIHLWDGNYTHGNYDVALPQHRFSSAEFGWSYTEGYYIGAAYCAEVYRKYEAGDLWEHVASIRGPNQSAVSRYWYWYVVPIPLGTLWC